MSIELRPWTCAVSYLMQDGEELSHSDRPGVGGGRGELLPDGAPVLLGQEEPDVAAGLQNKRTLSK